MSVPRGFKDWFRRAYVLARSSESVASGVVVNPGEEKALITLTGPLVVRLIRIICASSEIDKYRLNVYVDGKLLTGLWLTIEDIVSRYYWRDSEVFHVLYADPGGPNYTFEIRLPLAALETFKLAMSVDSTASYSATFSAIVIYEKYYERRRELEVV